MAVFNVAGYLYVIEESRRSVLGLLLGLGQPSSLTLTTKLDSWKVGRIIFRRQSVNTSTVTMCR